MGDSFEVECTEIEAGVGDSQGEWDQDLWRRDEEENWEAAIHPVVIEERLRESRNRPTERYGEPIPLYIEAPRPMGPGSQEDEGCDETDGGRRGVIIIDADEDDYGSNCHVIDMC